MPGLFAYLLNGPQLGNRFGQLSLCLGIINIGSAIFNRLFRCLLRFQSACLVEIAAAYRGVGQNGHDTGLHFKHTA